MKKHRISIIILIILVIIIAINIFSNRSSTLKKTDTRFVIDTGDIRLIQVKNKKDSFSIFQNNQLWFIGQNKPVNPSFLNFVMRIASQLKVTSAVPKNNLKALHDSILLNGVEIKYFDKNHHLLNQYYLFPDKGLQKTYALKINAKKPYFVELPGYEGNFAEIYYLPESYWYNPVIINYQPDQLSEINIVNVNNLSKSFTIQIFNNKAPALYNYKNITLPYNIDAMKAYLIFFRNIMVERYIDNSSISDSLLKVQPVYTIRIRDTQGIEKSLKIYPVFEKIENKMIENKNYYYVFTENQLIGAIKYYFISPILRDIDYFNQPSK
jgi:hypothetical protein